MRDLIHFTEPPHLHQNGHARAERQVYLPALGKGEFRFKNDLVFVLENIHARRPRAAQNFVLTRTAAARKCAAEQAIHFVLQSSQIAKRVIFYYVHFSNLQKFV